MAYPPEQMAAHLEEFAVCLSKPGQERRLKVTHLKQGVDLGGGAVPDAVRLSLSSEGHEVEMTWPRTAFMGLLRDLSAIAEAPALDRVPQWGR